MLREVPVIAPNEPVPVVWMVPDPELTDEHDTAPPVMPPEPTLSDVPVIAPKEPVPVVSIVPDPALTEVHVTAPVATLPNEPAPEVCMGPPERIYKADALTSWMDHKLLTMVAPASKFPLTSTAPSLMKTSWNLVSPWKSNEPSGAPFQVNTSLPVMSSTSSDFMVVVPQILFATLSVMLIEGPVILPEAVKVTTVVAPVTSKFSIVVKPSNQLSPVEMFSEGNTMPVPMVVVPVITRYCTVVVPLIQLLPVVTLIRLRTVAPVTVKEPPANSPVVDTGPDHAFNDEPVNAPTDPEPVR